MSKFQSIDNKDKIEFDTFRFDFAKNTLWQGESLCELPPKPSELLRLLLLNPGELVSREEIVSTLWKEQIIDYDQNINFCMKQVRQVLMDDPKKPQFIETVPKKGYRFISSYTLEQFQTDQVKKNGTGLSLVNNKVKWGAGVALLFIAVSLLIWWPNEPLQATYNSKSEAEQAVQRAYYLYEQGGNDNYTKALRLYEKAMTLDASLPDAYAGIALLKLYDAHDKTTQDSVREMSDKALKLNSESALAHLSKAKVSMYLDWDMVSAKQHFIAASKSNPNSIPVLHDLAVVAAIQGDQELARESIEKALMIDPGRFQEHYHAGWFYQVIGEYDIALKQCIQSLEIEPEYWYSLLCAGRSAFELKLGQTASHYLRSLMHKAGEKPERVQLISEQIEAGDMSGFNRWYVEFSENNNADPFDLALAYAEQAEHEKAIESLRKAIAQKHIMVPTAWAFDEMKELRKQPEFKNVMKVVKRF